MSEFDRILGTRAVRAHLQPIVSLQDRAVVGYEALARGPAGSPLEFPDRLFAAAGEAGRLGDLDSECVRAAFAAARQSSLRSPGALFVNVEPACFEGPPDWDAPATIIFEITERGLAARPAELLLAVEGVRARGWGIAVDDVGADWRSLALLPFLRPDVVKLDRSVLADAASPTSARVVRGARAHIERHGGFLLAEGVEEAGHERRARAFGARLGQGWLYGRPQALDAAPTISTHPRVKIVQPYAPIGALTPFQVLREQGQARAVATKAELLPLSIDLEREAAGMRDPAVVLATFQDAAHFGPTVRARYANLARGAAFVAAFGVGLSPEPAPGVRGANLTDGETMQHEWTVIVVGPHTALALIARDLGDTSPDMDRRFEYVLTEDRALVMRAARGLMLRVASEPTARPAIRADLAGPALASSTPVLA